MKPKPTDGIVSRYINRKISTRLTKFLIKHNTPITPNQMTIISLLVSLLTAFLIWRNYLLIGGIMIQISSIIDGMDGEIARAKSITTPLGGFLDATLDRLADIAIIGSIGYVILENKILPANYALLITILAITGDLMVSYIHARGEASLKRHPSSIGKLKGFAGRDVRLLILALLVAASLPQLALIVVGLISYFYVFGKIVEVYFTERNLLSTHN